MMERLTGRPIPMPSHGARAKDGSPKFVRCCTLPLTESQRVDMIITDRCVFSRPDRRSLFGLIELAPGIRNEEIAALVTAHYLSRGGRISEAFSARRPAPDPQAQWITVGGPHRRSGCAARVSTPWAPLPRRSEALMRASSSPVGSRA
jgi:hypothetical protein